MSAQLLKKEAPLNNKMKNRVKYFLKRELTEYLFIFYLN